MSDGATRLTKTAQKKDCGNRSTIWRTKRSSEREPVVRLRGQTGLHRRLALVADLCVGRNTRMKPKSLELVRLLARITRAGKIVWRKERSRDRWAASIGRERFDAEFIYLARTDDTGSDRAIARLTAFGIVLDYAIGTEGWELICEMLSTKDEEWREWKQRCDRQLAAGMTLLRRLQRSRP